MMLCSTSQSECPGTPVAATPQHRCLSDDAVLRTPSPPRRPRGSAQFEMDSPPPLPNRTRRGGATISGAILTNSRAGIIAAALRDDEDPNYPICVAYDDYSEIFVTGEVKMVERYVLPLLAAARLSTPGVVANLIKVGAAVNGVNDKNQTALHFLCLMPGPEFAPPPVDTKKKRPIMSSQMRCSLHGGEMSPTSREREVELTAYLLITNGCDMDKVDAKGSTALDYAMQFGHSQVVNVLLQAQDEVRRAHFSQILVYQHIGRGGSANGNTDQGGEVYSTGTKAAEEEELCKSTGRVCLYKLPKTEAARALTPSARRFAKAFVLPLQCNASLPSHAGCTAAFIGHSTTPRGAEDSSAAMAISSD